MDRVEFGERWNMDQKFQYRGGCERIRQERVTIPPPSNAFCNLTPSVSVYTLSRME